MFPSITASPCFRRFLKAPAAAGVRNYNGSTARFGGRMLHCWRAEDAAGKSTIWLGRISATGAITKARQILSDPAYDAQDPRLFVIGDDLWLMWSKVRDTRHGGHSWHVTQMVALLNPSTLLPANTERTWILSPQIKLRPVEKNWTPCPDGSVLYDMPAGLSARADGSVVRAPGFCYPWGSFSGSTPAMEWQERGTWLVIYHGFLHHVRRGKRYYFGAAEVCPRTHEVLRISHTPLVFASDHDEALPCPRDAKYNPCVVFPAGLVREECGRWLVSGGVHDSLDAWWSFSEDDLRLVPRAEALLTDRLLADPRIAAAYGRVVVRVGKSPICEDGITYLPGDHFDTSIARAAALAAVATPI